MRITKALAVKLTNDYKKTLDALDIADVAYIVKKANDAYHSKGVPFISDAIFDNVKEYLEARAPTNEAVVQIGAVPVGKKVKLPFFMGSMDKIKTDDRAMENFKAQYRGSYLVTDKLDGISALLYATPTTVHLYTRGDGMNGQDVSHLLKLIDGVPSDDKLKKLAVAAGGVFSVRGELILSKANFEKVKARGANPRNMVSGIVNAKKPDLEIARLINFIVYKLMSPQTMLPSAAFEHVVSNGFNVAFSVPLKALAFDNLSTILLERRATSIFEVDGIVVAHEGIYENEKSTNPKHSFAFKNIITQEIAEVPVTRVEWNVSKDGYLIPVVVFDPVQLNGVMIKRASGFNGEYIKTQKIGPGAIIAITRSGDVIPYIVKVVVPAEPQMPTEKYYWNATGKDIMLEEMESSREVQLKQIDNFFSKLNVASIRTGTITKLFDAGLDTLSKILAASAADIAKIDGFQIKSAEKIVDSIRAKLSVLSCVDFMDASNAFGRGFGSKRLTAIIGAIPAIAQDMYIPSVSELNAIDGVSTKTADAFIKGLVIYRQMKMSLNLQCDKHKIQKVAEKVNKSTKMDAQVVVFTGFRDKDMEKFIEENGGSIGDTITKKTTILVTKDGAKTTSKVDKAVLNGIVVYNKTEFVSKYGYRV
jgi:NAD-dependent DNA ligase